MGAKKSVAAQAADAAKVKTLEKALAAETAASLALSKASTNKVTEDSAAVTALRTQIAAAKQSAAASRAKLEATKVKVDAKLQIIQAKESSQISKIDAQV